MSDLPNDPAGEEDFGLPPDDDAGDEGDPSEGDDSEGDELPEGDEPGGEDEGDGEPPPRQTTRRPSQSERMRAKTTALEREIAELRQRVDRPAPQPQADPGAQARAEEEFRARLETMAPADAVILALRVGEQRAEARIARQEAAISERLDKQAYDTKAATSKLHRDYADRVERIVADERARGNVGISRLAVFRHELGVDAEKRAERAAPGQRRAAARRVAGQTTRPTGARGDGAPGGRSRNPDAGDDALLRSITAGDL